MDALNIAMEQGKFRGSSHGLSLIYLLYSGHPLYGFVEIKWAPRMVVQALPGPAPFLSKTAPDNYQRVSSSALQRCGHANVPRQTIGDSQETIPLESLTFAHACVLFVCRVGHNSLEQPVCLLE